MSKMICARLVEAGKPLVVSDGEIPNPPAQGLVVKTSFAGICHTDVHHQDGAVDVGNGENFSFTSSPDINLPYVLGHEIAGVVHSIGDEAGDTPLRVGDKVVVFPWVGCCKDECGYYASGNSNYCKVWGKSLGFGNPGGFGSHVPVPDVKFAVRVPDNLSLDTASLLPCSGLTAYNSILLAKPTVDFNVKCRGYSSLLIIGAGGLGMWCVQLAKELLPNTRIIVASTTEKKLEMAQEFGADKTVVWTGDEDDILSRTRAAGHEDGIDAVIDLVTTPETTQRSYACMSRGGVFVAVGLYGGSYPVALPMFVMQAHQMVSCFVGDLPMFRDLVKLVADKQIRPPPKVFFKLDEVNDAMDQLRNKKLIGRGIIRY